MRYAWLGALALAAAPVVALSGWQFWVGLVVITIVGMVLAIVIADREEA